MVSRGTRVNKGHTILRLCIVSQQFGERERGERSRVVLFVLWLSAGAIYDEVSSTLIGPRDFME